MGECRQRLFSVQQFGSLHRSSRRGRFKEKVKGMRRMRRLRKDYECRSAILSVQHTQFQVFFFATFVDLCNIFNGAKKTYIQN